MDYKVKSGDVALDNCDQNRDFLINSSHKSKISHHTKGEERGAGVSEGSEYGERRKLCS